MRGDMTFIYLITDLSIGFSIFASLVLWVDKNVASTCKPIVMSQVHGTRA